MLKNIRRRKKQ